MNQPFVLLDGGVSGTSRLYRGLVETIHAASPGDIAPALARIDASQNDWLGYITYEAGFALEPKLAPLAASVRPPHRPLLWLARFAHCDTLSDSEVAAFLSDSADGPAALGPMRPEVSFAEYAGAFADIARAIQAGDIYQANLTFPLSGPWHGSPFALYALLRRTAGSRHGALLHDGQTWTLSLSPELFFRASGAVLVARPMKGTAPRGSSPQDDAALALALSRSDKNRSENLMIVDLLRNDLSRVARPGTVRVDRLFGVETYPTIHQMTSTIRAETMPGSRPSDLLRGLFPCGSITGAPKIRAMELIHALERHPRGIYCGSIGRIAGGRKNDGEIELNVAIRTLELDATTGLARMGVGSGIVAQSSLEDEWQECLLKARFLSAAFGAS